MSVTSNIFADRIKNKTITEGSVAPSILVLPVKTPVNAVAASGVVTFTGTPLVHVSNVQATGTVTVTGTPVADENLVIGTQTFLFKALRSGVGEITIDADNTQQATNILAAVTLDITAQVTGISNLGVVTLTAVAAGTAGNSVALTTTATGVAVSGAGTLASGIDHVHESITIGIQEFIFVTARSGAGSFEITVNANNTTQGDNLVAALADVSNVTGSNSSGAVTITAAVKGVAGNNIVLSESATGTAVSSVTGGKIDGGVDGTVGVANEIVADANYIYRALAANTISDANWRRSSWGSVY